MFSVSVEDLSQLVSEPQKKLEQQAAQFAAKRGIDILMFTPACWMVCTLCTLPTIAVGGLSVCCIGPARIQGWTL
jgi:hypothetical protein